MDEIFVNTHRRFNPLTGEWVLIASDRLKRPWQAKVEKLPAPRRLHYDPGCYLCPEKTDGEKNPDYVSTHVFDNDFRSLSNDTPAFDLNETGVFRGESERGICRAKCSSPRHDLPLAEMDEADVRGVVATWKNEFERLGTLAVVNHIQVFENKGELMGCSSPHPHCQVWAESSILVEPANELTRLEQFHREEGKCLLCE